MAETAATNPRWYRRPSSKPAEGRSVHPIVKWAWMEMQHQRMTVTQLSKTSGIGMRTINCWIRGATSPKLKDVEAIVNALGYHLRVTVGEGSQALTPSPVLTD